MKDHCNKLSAMGVQFGIGVVESPFNEDWEWSTSHSGANFVDLVLTIRRQLGRLSDKVHLVENKVRCFRVRLHLMEVSTFHSTNRQLIRDRH